MDFIEELKWRGMIHDMTPDTDKRMAEGMVVGYAGFDPTAKSLQVGNLVAIMLLVHLQRAGHKPLALVGGATGMVGDPSGKSEERNLLSEEEVQENMNAIKKQLEHFLDFSDVENGAEIVNNYDWFKEFKFLDFLRDAGKHLTVSYMMAKDSVQSRLATGLSFTEFSYQLLQGYDYYHLNETKKCELQIGGSDQWGNITAGTELIRRKSGNKAYALTCPLVTKADGTKFGKSAAGEKLWLDAEMTSPYKFYQFWLNCSDEDAGRFLKVFTLLSKEEIEKLEKDHAEAPHTRLMQKALAEEVTVRVHSQEAYDTAVEASAILFGKGTKESLSKLSKKDFLDIFQGVETFKLPKSEIEEGFTVLDLVSDKTTIFPSKGEARRMIKGNGLSINKEKITDENYKIDSSALLNDAYILAQKGKKNYFIIEVE